MRVALLFVGACALAGAQNTGNQKANLNPGVSMEECTGSQNCQKGKKFKNILVYLYVLFFII